MSIGTEVRAASQIGGAGLASENVLVSPDAVLRVAQLQLWQTGETSVDRDSASLDQWSRTVLSEGSPEHSFNYSNRRLWSAFTLRNTTAHSDWVISPVQLLHSRVTVYVSVNRGPWVKYVAGTQVPLGERDYRVRGHGVKVDFPQNSEARILVSFESANGFDASLELASQASFERTLEVQNVFLGIFYGFLIAILLYNFFLYVAVRDASYLYYVFFGLLNGVTLSSINGCLDHFTGYRGLGDHLSGWACLALAASVVFTRRFLGTSRSEFRAMRAMDTVLKSLLVLHFAGLVVDVVGLRVAAGYLSDIAIATTCTAVIAAGITGLKANVRSAAFFLVSWTSLILGVATWMGVYYGVLPKNPATLFSFHFGSCAELLFFSFALADRINDLQKQVIQVMTESKSVLEARIAERTRELQTANRAVIVNAKMSALGEMAGGVAHEINTPLATIGLSVEIAEELLSQPGTQVDAIRPSLRRIRETSLHIGRIVRSLRAFARQESSAEPEAVSVVDILTSTVDLCSERFKVAGVSLQVAADAAAGAEIAVRGSEVIQILVNLLNNAFDAVRGVRLAQVRIEVGASSGRVSFRVIDNGRGIAEELREKVFQPFFTTKPVGEGTGLGLSLSKGLAESNGGTLTLVSLKPTTFELDFPMVGAVREAA